MPTLTVTPNPAAPSSVVAVAGDGFLNAKTRLLLDGIGATTNVFRPRKDGTFHVGITVSTTPKTQTLIAEQQSGSTWTEKARTTIVVQVATPVPPPTLAYTTSVPAGSTIKGKVQWTATITAGTPTKMLFLIDGLLKWDERFAPWGGELDTASLSNGPHTLTIVGHDASGAHAPAGGLVTVDNVVLPGPEPSPVGAKIADYPTFAAAFEASKTKNKTLIITPGSWPVPGYINAYADFRLLGEDRATCILFRPAPAPHAAQGFFYAKGVAGVELGGVTLRGTGKPLPRTGQTGRGDDILLNPIDAPDFHAHDFSLVDAQGCGIQTEGKLLTGVIQRFEIINVFTRDNGFHGVGLWPYHGTSRVTFEDFLIDGTDYAGLMADAGTQGDPVAISVDDNIVRRFKIKNASRGYIGGWGQYPKTYGNGIELTGAARSKVTDWEVTDQAQGAAVAFGRDQSGARSTGNIFTTGVIARITSNIAVAFGGETGNVIDGVTGTGTVANASGNVILNAPNLVLA